MKFWQIDAFAERGFEGNPAAVVIHEAPLPDAYMQALAAEMNLSETAYVRLGGDRPYLRWFTPKSEIDLCGHATLASAHALFERAKWSGDSVAFDTNVAGVLTVARLAPGSYSMDFPARPGEAVAVSSVPDFVIDALGGKRPEEAYASRDLMLVYPDQRAIEEIEPDFGALSRFAKWIIVTAPGDRHDFVSRFFCSGDGIDEDPVTGSAHCTLAPYWARRLGRTALRARQVSARGGELDLRLDGDRVTIGGRAVTVASGELHVFP